MAALFSLFFVYLITFEVCTAQVYYNVDIINFERLKGRYYLVEPHYGALKIRFSKLRELYKLQYNETGRPSFYLIFWQSEEHRRFGKYGLSIVRDTSPLRVYYDGECDYLRRHISKLPDLRETFHDDNEIQYEKKPYPQSMAHAHFIFHLRTVYNNRMHKH